MKAEEEQKNIFWFEFLWRYRYGRESYKMLEAKCASALSQQIGTQCAQMLSMGTSCQRTRHLQPLTTLSLRVHPHLKMSPFPTEIQWTLTKPNSSPQELSPSQCQRKIFQSKSQPLGKVLRTELQAQALSTHLSSGVACHFSQLPLN